MDHNEAVEMPNHIDQVVDIVVSNERDKNEKIDAAASEYGEDSERFKDAMDELAADEANPFWKRLLEPDKAYGIDLTKPIAPILEKALNTGMSSHAGMTAQSNF